ncbi:MAG TPA: class I SAM-dependent methyltransferase [Patescibacteria group bacterium]|nr:class I SAM-dependent methyltransferase [Patescibacteria group bacterium]
MAQKQLFEFQRRVEKLSKPFEQKTEITGHLLPGVLINKQFCQDFAAGAATVTGMTIFGPFVYKDPTNFDEETVSQLGRKPRDYNFSQMWSNSGMDGYIFPEDDLYATLKFHTCKRFDAEKLLTYVHETLGFDVDMRYTEILEGKTTVVDKLYKKIYKLSAESDCVERFVKIFNWIEGIERVETFERQIQFSEEIRSAVADAIRKGVNQRVGYYFTNHEKEFFQKYHGTGEINIDRQFMLDAISGIVKSPDKHPLQRMYDRLSSMEVQAAGITKADRILHYGSGYGDTGVGVVKQFGIPFTCVEIKPDVAQLCRDTFDAFGLLRPNKLQVACADAREVDPKGYDVIIISAMVPEETKLQILDNISKLQWGKKGNRRLIIRTPSNGINAFLYPILTTEKFLSRPELKLVADTGTMCRPEDPLRSLVFNVEDGISYLRHQIEAKAYNPKGVKKLEEQRPKLRPVSDFII